MIESLNDIPSVAQYLNRINAEPRTLRSAVVREVSGKYWRDVAVIKITKTGDVKAPPQYEPTDAEASLIKAECAAAVWPEHQLVHSITNPPVDWTGVDPETIFEFRDEKDRIIMVQQRILDKEGERKYVPWTFFTDGKWRRMEPEGRLPIWGIDQLKDFTTVFIHEGAKAARAMRRMIEAKTEDQAQKLKAHPWGEELSAAAHIGWIGGALSPSRTDWTILKRLGIKRAYIVSDNDEAGVSAVPPISRELRVPTFHLQFTQDWPASFDLADEFPKSMFKKVGQSTYYVGPSFRSCLHPATWATEQIVGPPGPKGGKPTVTLALREEFKNLWAYVEEADVFVCKEMPEILRPELIVNKLLAPFSHTKRTSDLMISSYRGRNTKLCYRPDLTGRTVTDKTTSAINLHTPTHIKAKPGDASPWIEFLTYMFTDERERKEVMRWCATLIARPDIKMEFGLLLVSETQGIGKTTLGAKVLGPLVGDQNVGFPSEDDIVNSPFNAWVAHKRLIIIGEIYSGHSWKAYNKLKSYITDKDIDYNQKYMRPYRVENWAHVLASSNSRKALKMEETDRRWFYPKVTESKWPRAKFARFNEWLMSGGLQIIRHWAIQYGDYVMPGECAPDTELKKEMIKDSRSEAQQELADLCEAVVSDNVSVVLAMKEISAWLRAKLGGRVFDSNYDLRKAAEATGFRTFEHRIKVGSQLQYVMMSPKFQEEFLLKAGDLNGHFSGSPEARSMIREAVKNPVELIQSDM